MNAMFQRARSPWILASMAWIGLLLIFFFPVVFQGKVLAPLDILDHLMRPWSDGAGGFGVHNAFVYDAISQYLPYDWTVCQSLKQDGFIGWNPYVYGGYALLENTMLCPGDWHHQLYRIFDFWTAWDLGIILQFAIAGFGMLVMLRGEGIPALPAFIGVISFAFYSQHVIWIYHRWVLGTSCWFPWMVWAIRRAVRNNWLIDCWSVVFTVLSFRGGSLQTCLFVVLVVFCLFLEGMRRHPKNFQGNGKLHFFAFYVLLAVFSTLFLFDVLLDTIPPFWHGCRQMAQKGFADLLTTIPHLATSVFPFLFGSPQTLDASKLLGAELFEIKFGGAIPLVLAVCACPRRSAPFVPKAMIVLSLMIAFTPLTNWFYSRSTVVFGLGCAWLAAWQLSNADFATQKLWRRLKLIGVPLIVVWCCCGIVSAIWRPRLLSYLGGIVTSHLPADRIGRLQWMLARSEAFIDEIPPWSSQNLPFLVVVCIGLFVAFRRMGKRTESPCRPFVMSCILVLCVFSEMALFGHAWITFSEKPKTEERLFSDRSWTSRLLGEVSGGGYVWLHGTRPDFDYFQLNVQSGLKMPSLQGYETIRPESLSIPEEDIAAYDPEAFAAAGISHVLVEPQSSVPSGLNRWWNVVDSGDFHVFQNPLFAGRWMAVLTNGARVPVSDASDSPNQHVFNLPEGTLEVSLSEPFNRKWRIWTAKQGSPHADILKRADGGMRVVFETPVRFSEKLSMVFSPQHPVLTTMQVFAFLCLSFLSFLHNRRHQTFNQAASPEVVPRT